MLNQIQLERSLYYQSHAKFHLQHHKSLRLTPKSGKPPVNLKVAQIEAAVTRTAGVTPQTISKLHAKFLARYQKPSTRKLQKHKRYHTH
eukprot:gene2686-1684_t